MHTFIKALTEEIMFCRCQNFRLQMEDMLKAIEGERQIYQKQIPENEVRIERLWNSIQDFM